MKKIIFSFPLQLLVVFFLVENAHAIEYGTPQIGFSWSKRSSDEKIKYVKELLSFFGKIDEHIPSSSPSISKWLEKELEEYKKTKNNYRYTEIMNTKDYKINKVKNHIALIINNLILITKTPPLKKEIYLWSLIADSLLDEPFWSDLYILIEEFNLVDKKLFYSGSTGNIEEYDLFYKRNGLYPAWQILTDIIQPYLEK